MSIRRERALRRIDAILAGDLRPETAYPLRARLGRAALAAADWLNDERHLLDHATAVQAELLVQNLRSTSRRIMQPSEPFDSIWQHQWAEVLATLTTLRAQITQPARSR